MQIVPGCPALHYMHCLANDILQQFWFKAQSKVLLLKTGECQQIFHHAHKVSGFFLNGGGKGRVALCRSRPVRAGKYGGIATNTR